MVGVGVRVRRMKCAFFCLNLSAAMYCNDYISVRVRCLVRRVRRNSKRVRPFREVTEIVPLLQEQKHTNGMQQQQQHLETIEEDSRSGRSGSFVFLWPFHGIPSSPRFAFADERADNPWRRSPDSSYCGFCLRWPITTALWLTIPDCRRYPRLRVVTFAMCILWIGMTSYLVAFLITVVGMG